MTDPLLLHTQARRAHQQAITALKGIAQCLHGEGGQIVAEDALHVVHEAFARAETELANSIDGAPATVPKYARAAAVKRADEMRSLDQCERLIRTGIAAPKVARIMGYTEPRSLYRWLKRQGRDDLVDALKARKKS